MPFRPSSLNARGDACQLGDGTPGWSLVGDAVHRRDRTWAIGWWGGDLLDYARDDGHGALEHWRHDRQSGADALVGVCRPRMLAGMGETIGDGGWSLEHAFPPGGVAGDIDPIDGWVVCLHHAGDSHALTVARRGSALVTLPGAGGITWIKCRGSRLVWYDDAGLHAYDLGSGALVAPPARLNSAQVVPVSWRGEWWAVALVDAPLRHGLAVYRWADASTGYGWRTGDGEAAYPWNFDARALEGGRLRVKWSRGEGEHPGEGVVHDLTPADPEVDLRAFFAGADTPEIPPIPVTVLPPTLTAICAMPDEPGSVLWGLGAARGRRSIEGLPWAMQAAAGSALLVVISDEPNREYAGSPDEAKAAEWRDAVTEAARLRVPIVYYQDTATYDRGALARRRVEFPAPTILPGKRWYPPADVDDLAGLCAHEPIVTLWVAFYRASNCTQADANAYLRRAGELRARHPQITLLAGFGADRAVQGGYHPTQRAWWHATHAQMAAGPLPELITTKDPEEPTMAKRMPDDVFASLMRERLKRGPIPAKLTNAQLVAILNDAVYPFRAQGWKLFRKPGGAENHGKRHDGQACSVDWLIWYTDGVYLGADVFSSSETEAVPSQANMTTHAEGPRLEDVAIDPIAPAGGPVDPPPDDDDDDEEPTGDLLERLDRIAHTAEAALASEQQTKASIAELVGVVRDGFEAIHGRLDALPAGGGQPKAYRGQISNRLLGSTTVTMTPVEE